FLCHCSFFFHTRSTFRVSTLSLRDALPISFLVPTSRSSAGCRPLSMARRRPALASPSRTPASTPPRSKPAPRKPRPAISSTAARSEEHTSELQSRENLVCRLLLEKKNIEYS